MKLIVQVGTSVVNGMTKLPQKPSKWRHTETFSCVKVSAVEGKGD